MSVLQGKPKRSGWRGDATSGFLGRRSALFKHALHAVIVRRVAGAQWGERGASMGYGLWALRLCGSAALGALAPWRRGGAVCLSFGSCVYEARGADATRALYVQTRQMLTGRPRNETHARTHIIGRVAYVVLCSRSYHMVLGTVHSLRFRLGNQVRASAIGDRPPLLLVPPYCSPLEPRVMRDDPSSPASPPPPPRPPILNSRPRRHCALKP